jgi:hypothetical protein
VFGKSAGQRVPAPHHRLAREIGQQHVDMGLHLIRVQRGGEHDAAEELVQLSHHLVPLAQGHGVDQRGEHLVQFAGGDRGARIALYQLAQPTLLAVALVQLSEQVDLVDAGGKEALEHKLGDTPDFERAPFGEAGNLRHQFPPG